MNCAETFGEDTNASRKCKEQVLIVDDDATVLGITSELLAGAGLECRTTSCPSEALRQLARMPAIRVVLSDIVMPGMNGIEFARRLAALGRSDVRLVLLTGQPSLEMAIDALRLGVCDFLMKPLRAAQLIDAVRRAMVQPARPKELNAGVPQMQDIVAQAQLLMLNLQQLASGSDSARRESCVSVPSKPLLETFEKFRRLRASYIAREKLDDAAWDMLLELASTQRGGKRLSVSGLLVSISHISMTSLLRRVNELVERGYITRTPDPKDGRRHYVALTPLGERVVSEFLEAIGAQPSAEGAACPMPLARASSG